MATALRPMALSAPLLPCASSTGAPQQRPLPATARTPLRARTLLAGGSLRKSRAAEARRARGPVAVRAASDTFWVTATSAVAVVLGLAGTGVLVGVLFQYKCWRDAEAQVEQLRRDGKSTEEITLVAIEELREQGIQVLVEDSSTKTPSDLVVATLEASQQGEEGGDLPVRAGASIPVAAAVGRRRRPQQSE